MEIGISDPGIKKFIGLTKQQTVLERKLKTVEECCNEQIAKKARYDLKQIAKKARYDLEQTHKGIQRIIGQIPAMI